MWAEQHVDKLRELAAIKLGSRKIAEQINGEFGTTYSKNSVISVARRHDIALGKVGAYERVARAPRRHTPKPVRRRAVRPTGPGKTLLELIRRDCRWPVGDPRNADFHYCAAPSASGKPYCEFHCNMAYQGRPTGDQDGESPRDADAHQRGPAETAQALQVGGEQAR